MISWEPCSCERMGMGSVVEIRCSGCNHRDGEYQGSFELLTDLKWTCWRVISRTAPNWILGGFLDIKLTLPFSLCKLTHVDIRDVPPMRVDGCKAQQDVICMHEGIRKTVGSPWPTLRVRTLDCIASLSAFGWKQYEICHW